jgi:hypothetical protein
MNVRRRIVFAAAIVVTVAVNSFTQTAAGEAAHSFRDTVAAGGTNTIIMPVATWGRYSVQSSGSRPIALSIADRRSGVIRRDGTPGDKHGRIDMFLEIGDYKIGAQGLKNAKGSATITAFPFTYAADVQPAYLIPLRENMLKLHDLQQCAFWFDVLRDTTVYIEAAGRYLDDLRLWRDGEWLVDSRNRPFTARPKPETPLTGIILTATIPKGTYMVAAYGGRGKEWSVTSADAPLYLQSGRELLAVNSTTTMIMPPKGYLRMLVAARVSAIVVEEPERVPLSIEVTGIAIDSIGAKSSAPRMMLSIGEGSAEREITLTGTPGQPFTIQTLGNSDDRICDGGSTWWISSMHTGNFRDQFGASGCIIGNNESIVALCADTLADNREMAKRFNFLSEGRMSAYVWVDDDGPYWISSGGTGFSWRMSRFYRTYPPNYKAPDFANQSGSVSLNRGLYMLELMPKKKGIASIVIQKTSLVGSMYKAGKELVAGPDDNRAWIPPRPCTQFGVVTRGSDQCYTVLLNNQDPEIAVVTARELPLDPDQPVSFWAGPGQKITLPVTLRGRRLVSVRDGNSRFVPFKINGVQYDTTGIFEAGACTFEVTGTGPDIRRVVFASQAPERVPTQPPPPFPDEKRLAIPTFPPLVTGKTLYLDLDRTQATPYALKVATPGFYRIETMGRLNTRLAIRDRFLYFSHQEESNGIGRNAMLIDYLLAGSYQVDVATLGRSAGHLGLAACQNPLVEGGSLEPGIDNRNFAPAYSGVVYDVRVPETGPCQVESFGMNGAFPFRLEDTEGWPFEPVVNNEPLTTTISKGTCRLISMPSMMDSRRLARLTLKSLQRTAQGKGPHPLEINTPLSLVWKEGKDSVQSPAVFTFTLPAPVTVTLTASGGFDAVLYESKKDSALASWSGKKTLDLSTGNYRLCVKPQHKSNLAPYQVSVSTRDLIAGLSYDLSKPRMLRVSIGSTGVAEFGSQGMLDAAAVLYESDAKTVIAANDDGFLDWNFAIARALKPGRYFLKVESAEGQFTATTIFMRSLTDTVFETLACAKEGVVVIKRDLKRRLAVFPIAAADTGDILSCALKGRSRMGISLEKSTAGAGGWLPVAQVSGDRPMVTIPREARSAYRLKVWSEGNVEESFELTYRSTTATPATWTGANSGLSGQAVAMGGEYCAWFKLDLGSNAPGHFRTVSSRNQLSGVGASARFDSLFVDESAAWFSAESRFVWVEFHCEQAGSFNVRLDPMVLEKNAAFTMPLIGNRPRAFAARVPNNTLMLLAVESDGQQPLCGVASAPAAKRQPLVLKGISVHADIWISRDRCATVALAGDEPKAAIWNALPPIDGTHPAVRITATELPITDIGTLKSGVSTWIADKPSALAAHFTKTSARVRVRVTLPPASAALMTRSDGSRVLACSPGDEPIVQDLYTDGGDLYLLALKNNTRFDCAAFLIGSDDAATAAITRPLTLGTSWQAKSTTEGTLLIPVAGASTNCRLFFTGALNSVGWIGNDGMLRPNLADGASIRDNGFLIVGNSIGWMKLDLCDNAGSTIACKWGAALTATGATPIDQSSVVRLGDRVNWFTFTLADTHHVNFSAPLPLAALLIKDGTPVNYQETWEQFNWDLPLGPGKYQLGIHPIAGSSLEGGQLAALYRPIDRLSEKMPFTAYIAAGESRLLSFEVRRKDRFGIGLRMTNETAQARLYDAHGAVIDQGKQQFVELDKGVYFVWVRVPATAAGTSITVFLFGQEPPPNQPPEQLVKWIIDGAQGPRPVVKTVSDDIDEKVPPRPAEESYDQDESQSTDEQSGSVGEDEESSQDEQPESDESGDESDDSDSEE